MRLAFAVAIFTQPDILLIDEILAVGDTAFQIKCIKKMEEFKKMGVTTLFVSHSLEAVKQFCSRVIYMKDGKVEFDGEVNEGINKYINGK
jgi:ABC-type polysaccharide/polyol phosphate transport system ATPase subunit